MRSGSGDTRSRHGRRWLVPPDLHRQCLDSSAALAGPGIGDPQARGLGRQTRCLSCDGPRAAVAQPRLAATAGGKRWRPPGGSAI
jgi:hypothetical protein